DDRPGGYRLLGRPDRPRPGSDAAGRRPGGGRSSGSSAVGGGPGSFAPRYSLSAAPRQATAKGHAQAMERTRLRTLQVERMNVVVEARNKQLLPTIIALREQGLSAQAIAGRVGVHSHTVLAVLKRAGRFTRYYRRGRMNLVGQTFGR